MNVSWEDLTPEMISGYRRYPMNFRLALGWGFLSFLALVVATTIHYAGGWALREMYTRFGANVLIHLTMNAIMIHGFFGVHRWSLDKATNKISIVLGVSFTTIAGTQLLIYLARSARK